MEIKLESKANSFILNGVEYAKGDLSVFWSPSGVSIGGKHGELSEIQCDGQVLASMSALHDYISANLFKSGGGSGGGAVESVTGDLVTGTPTNPIVDLPDWVNEIKNGRFTSIRTIVGVSNLIPSDAGCLIISSHDPDDPQDNELIFNDDALEVQERFVILNEYPIKLTNSNDATVIVPDGYLPEAVGNGLMVWVVKTDTGTYYAFGEGLKRADVNDKMVMTIATDGTAKPTPLAIKHLTNIGGFPAFSNGVHVATAMNSGTQTGLLSFVKFNNNAAEAGTFPMYGTGGVLKVANAVATDDAVNLSYLDSKFRGFDDMINVTNNRTLSISDAGFGRALVIDGNNLVMSLPATAAGFSAGNVINLFNINTSHVEISNAGSVFNIISNSDLRHIADKAYARLVYLGNNNFFLEGELTAI